MKLPGREGEDRAVSFLERNGYRIVERNVRVPGGEIDLICTERDTIVFVEMKARSGRRFGSAFSAVDSKKRAKLRALAADYLQIVAPTARARFDVVALDGTGIALHRNAF
ncbi:MAG: YraN family protein [Candidatus Eremiobacteraeota bacterium]|nr:YraN family protein [Candidatus Eremiobacteraeota bacterium]